MKENTSPRPDNIFVEFYQKHWSLVKNDIIELERKFVRGRMSMKYFNSMMLTLIPKVHTPTKMVHYRPISCINMIYKNVYKMLVERIAHGIPYLISKNQSAFVHGRLIYDNSAWPKSHCKVSHRRQHLYEHVSPSTIKRHLTLFNGMLWMTH